MRVELGILVYLCFGASLAYGQDISINGFETNTIYIGLDNKLDYNGTDELLFVKSVSFHIRIVQEEKEVKLFGTRRSNNNPIILEFKNKQKDTIYLNVERLEFKQFAIGDDKFAIQSGTYPKSLLTKLRSIAIKFNCPWVDSPVVGFEIVIRNGDEILYKGFNKGGSLMNSEIREAMSLLTSKGTIHISKIHARLPYDDGDRPKDMVFTCQ